VPAMAPREVHAGGFPPAATVAVSSFTLPLLGVEYCREGSAMPLRGGAAYKPTCSHPGGWDWGGGSSSGACWPHRLAWRLPIEWAVRLGYLWIGAEGSMDKH